MGEEPIAVTDLPTYYPLLRLRIIWISLGRLFDVCVSFFDFEILPQHPRSPTSGSSIRQHGDGDIGFSGSFAVSLFSLASGTMLIRRSGVSSFPLFLDRTNVLGPFRFDARASRVLCQTQYIFLQDEHRDGAIGLFLVRLAKRLRASSPRGRCSHRLLVES